MYEKANRSSTEFIDLDISALEKAAARDRVYFERHPRLWSYIRPEIPGETMREALPPGWRVIVNVLQLEPGVRLRRFATVPVGRALQ